MAGGFTKLAFSFPPVTEVHACSLLFNDRMYLFGGANEERQISRVTGCGLKRIGDLNFDFSEGTCTLMQSSTVLLCFAWSNYEGKVCRVADSPTASFKTIRDSNYNHYGIKIASNGGNSILSFILY